MGQCGKPVIFLCSGAAHIPESWDLVQQELDRLGYESATVQYPTVSGLNSDPVGLKDDIEAVRESLLRILDEEKKDVVVLMHSYGGAVGSDAVEGLCIDERPAGKKGILGLIYMSTFLIKVEECFANLSTDNPDDSIGKVILYEKGELERIFTDPDHYFYHDHTPERAARYKALLRPTTVGAVFEGPSYSAWTRDIWKSRCRYIICANDRCIPLEKQQSMTKDSNMKVAATLDSGHIPQSVVEKELSKVLADVAQDFSL